MRPAPPSPEAKLTAWPALALEAGPLRSLVGALSAAQPAADPARAGNVYGSAQALIVAALADARAGSKRTAAAPLLVVTQGLEEADDVREDLRAFGLAEERALRFPAWESLPAKDALPNFSVLAERLEVLRRLARGEGARGGVIVTPVAAILQPVPEAEVVRRASIPLRRGEECPPELLEKALSQAGFERAPMVELPGEWSRRGGIVDVFPLSGGGPFRIEYWGDEIDSIREVDTESQRSIRELDALEIVLTGVESLFRGADVLQRTLLDFLPEGTAVVVLEPARTEGMALELTQRFGEKGAYLAAARFLEGIRTFPRLELSALPLEGGLDLGTRSVERAISVKVEEIASGVSRLIAEGAHVTILAPRAAERERLRELLTENGCPPGPALTLEEGDIAKGFHAPFIGKAALTTRELFHHAVMRRPASRKAKHKGGRPIQSFLELRPGDLVVHVVHGIGRYLGVERMENDGRLQDYLRLEYADQAHVLVPATKIELVQRYVGARGFAPHLSKIGTGGWQKHKARVKAAVMDLAADLIEVHARRDHEQGHAFPEDDSWQTAFEAAFPYEDTPDQAAATDAIKGDMQRKRPMDRMICGDVGYGKTELAMRAAFKAAIAGKQVAVLVPTTILAEQHLESFRARMREFPVKIECVNRFRSGKDARKILERVQKGEADILIGTHRILSQDVVFRDLGLVVIDEEQRFGVAHKERLKRLRKTVDVLTLTATPIPRTLHMSLLGIKDLSGLETPPEGRLAVETVITRADPALIREAILRELARGGQCYFIHNRVQSIDRRADELSKLVPEARFAVIHGQMDEELVEQRMMGFVHGLADVLVATTIIESGVDIPRANTIFIDRADAFGLADLHQLRGRVGRYKHRAYAYLLLPKSEALTEIAERRLKAIEEFNELGAGFRIAMRDLEIRGAGNILGPEQSGHIATVGYDLYCRLLKEAVEELKRLPPEARANARRLAEQAARGTVGDGAVDAFLDAQRRASEGGQDGEAVALGVVGEVAEGDGAGASAGPSRGGGGKAVERVPVELGPEAGVELELNVEALIPDRYIPEPKQKIEAYRKLAAARDDDDLLDVERELRDRFGPLPEAARRLVRWNRLRVACERCAVYRVSFEGKVAVLRFVGDGKALRMQLAYSRVKAMWPAPETCFAVIAEEPGMTPEQALDRAIQALCLERKDPPGREPERQKGLPRSAAERARARAAEGGGTRPSRRASETGETASGPGAPPPEAEHAERPSKPIFVRVKGEKGGREGRRG